MATIRNTAVLVVACILAALGLIAAATATADEGEQLTTPGLEIQQTPDAPGPGSEFVAGDPAAYSIEIHNSGAAEAT